MKRYHPGLLDFVGNGSNATNYQLLSALPILWYFLAYIFAYNKVFL